MSAERWTVCARRALAGEFMGAACPDCGHTNIAHASSSNPSLDACAICELVVARTQAEAERRADT